MKNVVITGSTRGIGFEMAKEFLKQGCNVTISGRNATPPVKLEDELIEFRKKYHYVPCNVQNKKDIESLWNSAKEQWGTVDIWINNAGQNVPHEFSYDTDSSSTEAVIHTNILGIIYGAQVAAKNMLIQGSGQIWNMEGLGSNNMIQVKTILYGTTKHALTYFSKGLAKELDGTPVKVGRLSPGMMLTDFITKAPDGTQSPVLQDKSFQFVFNALADRPETVASFFVPRILKNNKNNAHIVWLTNAKSMWRFLKYPVLKRELI